MSRAIALLILLAQCAPCGAQELGRLFFSLAERDALDAQRSAKPGKAPAGAQAPERIEGYVLRSGGRSTVWVTGGAIRSNAGVDVGGTPDHARVRDVIGDGQVRVQR